MVELLNGFVMKLLKEFPYELLQKKKPMVFTEEYLQELLEQLRLEFQGKFWKELQQNSTTTSERILENKSLRRSGKGIHAKISEENFEESPILIPGAALKRNSGGILEGTCGGTLSLKNALRISCRNSWRKFL